MLLAGLTGFLNADADNMKAEVAAKRKAEADRLAGITGWQKKAAENAMKNASEQHNTFLKAKLDGKVSLSDGFGIAAAENKEYISNWNPSKGVFNLPNKDLSKFAKIISDTDKYKTFIKASNGETVYKSPVDTNNLTIGNATAWVAEIGGKLKSSKFRDELKKMDDNAFNAIASRYDVSLATVLNKAKEQQVDMGSIDIDRLFSFNIMDELASGRNQKINALSNSLDSKDAAINKIDGKVITYDVNSNDENDKIGSSKFLNALKATENNVAKVWSNNYTLASQTAASKQNSLIMSKALFKNEDVNIEALDPNRGADYTSIFTNKEATIRYRNHVEASAKKAGLQPDDHVGRIMALSAGMTTDKEYVNQVLDGNPYRKKPDRTIAMKAYAIDSVFSIDDPTKAIKKFDDVKTESEFSSNVYTTLKQYKDARKGVGKGVAAVESIMTKLGIIVDRDTGVIGTIINRFNSGESGIAGEGKVISVNGITQSADGVDDSANNEEQLTSGYLKTLEANTVGKAGKNIELAKLEALRISLAFMLARQADPSGRLSNQDIDQQLRRLGGVGLNDGAMDEAKIDLLLAETARKRDKYATIITIADSGAAADDKAKRIIDAAIAYDKLNDKYGLYNAQGKIDGSQGSSATGTSIDLKEMYKNKPRYRTVLPNSETYKNTPSLLKRFPNGYHLDLKGFNKITITPKTGA